jgi:hypothetical protein
MLTFPKVAIFSNSLFLGISVAILTPAYAQTTLGTMSIDLFEQIDLSNEKTI